jgi:hypothetical protein
MFPEDMYHKKIDRVEAKKELVEILEENDLCKYLNNQKNVELNIEVRESSSKYKDPIINIYIKDKKDETVSNLEGFFKSEGYSLKDIKRDKLKWKLVFKPTEKS